MILSGDSIKQLKIITPFREKYKKDGVSGGVSYAGYDIALAKDVEVPSGGFTLGVSLEEFNMPTFVLGVVHDKSTWARMGIFVQNTIIEPGWKGFLTLEISDHDYIDRHIAAGTPIAQVVFHMIDRHVPGYNSKYQNAPQVAQGAILE